MPPGYTRRGRLFEDLEDRPLWWWLAMGNLLALLPLAAGVLLLWLPYQLYAALGTPLALFALPDDFVPEGLPGAALTAVLCLLTMLLHEGLHAAALGALGYGARLSFAGGYLYATVPPGVLLTRRAYLRMALAPLALLSLAGGAALPFLPAALGHPLVLALLLNAAASVGDLAVTQRLLRCPPDALFADEGTIVVYVRADG